MTDAADPVDELLRAVFLAPADNNSRLVLADYLMDRGDPRGELIQLQCTMATASGEHHAELMARERELLEARPPPRGTTVSYARGLCESAIVEANTADAALGFLEGELVIHHLVLTGCGGSTQRWHAIGRLLRGIANKVRSLRFEGVIWYWHDSDGDGMEEIDERMQLTAVLEGAPRPRHLIDLEVPEGTAIPMHWRGDGE